MTIYYYNRRKVTTSLLLNVSFILGLVGIIVSAVLYHFTAYHIKIYYLIYFCYGLITLKVFHHLNKIVKTRTTMSVLIIIFYVLIITCPITYLYNSPIMILIGLKSLIIPFLLSFLLLLNLNSEDKLNYFLKLIVYGGVFASLFIIFEFFNKYLNIAPLFNSMIYKYSLVARGTSSLVTDTNIELLQSMKEKIIRPAGIFFNYTNNGYFIASCFFIILLTGKYFIKKIYMIRLIMILLYLGVLLSTSRQIIISSHLIILFLFLIKKGRFKTPTSLYLKRGIHFTLYLVGFVIFVSLYYFANYFYDLIGKDTNTFNIIFEGFLSVPAKIVYLLSEQTIYGLFGIGFHNAVNVGVYNEIGINIEEIHFLFYLIIEIGILGFIFYWLVFFNAGLVCWRKYKSARFTLDSNPNFYLLGLILMLLFASCLIHYPPQNISTHYIIALSIYIGFLAENKMTIFKKAEAIYPFKQ